MRPVVTEREEAGVRKKVRGLGSQVSFKHFMGSLTAMALHTLDRSVDCIAHY